MLSIYYLLNINFSLKEKKRKKTEPVLHAFPLLFGFGSAISYAVLDLYNSASLWCWLDATDISNVLRYYLYYGPVIIIFVLVSVIMSIIYCHVRTQERSVEKYDLRQSQIKEALTNSNEWNSNLNKKNPSFRKEQQFGEGNKEMLEKNYIEEETGVVPTGLSSTALITNVTNGEE